MTRAVGMVSLVGAGPGNLDHLTLKAARRLREADLVLYDALVDERVLAFARKAQRFYVGKRAGRHALSQHEIQAVLVSQAGRGRRVVRLKGGDGIPMEQRRPLLLKALNRLYAAREGAAAARELVGVVVPAHRTTREER